MTAEHDELLGRFQPHLRYDANEQFFADSAAQYPENPGTDLRRARKGDKQGELIASAHPGAGEPKLTLAFLGPKTYANGAAVLKTDVIGIKGDDYRMQYVRLRTSRADLSNRVYGRAVQVNQRLWLQYWFWYFYNDYQLALGFGTHEGDWETVQLRMHDDEPDVAVYAQHSHGEKRNWEHVERVKGSPDTPVVYVARGSHASYFQAGFHRTDAWYDLADGKREAPKLTLEIVRPGELDWLLWPGRWGDSMPRGLGADLELEQASPTGPGTKTSWRNPDRMLDDARPSRRSDPPQAPDVKVTRKNNRIQIDYDLSKRAERPRALVVTVNSRNEKGVPPMTHTFEEVASKRKGTLKTAIPVHPARHYDVYTSTVAGDPPVPSASKYTELDAVEKERDAPLQQVAQTIGGIFARLRGER